MVRKQDRTAVYILLLAVIVAAIAGYYLPTKRPEGGTSITPKEYIELVEKKKAQRLKYAEQDTGAAEQNPDETAPTQE